MENKVKNRQIEELEKILKENFSNDGLAQKFLERIEEGKITRDENSKTHLCVYFAAYDPRAKEVFIGHHKKSGFWLFNGGHIDKGDTLKETLAHEIAEEWGLNIDDFEISSPVLLTTTEINNPTKQPCRLHYDLWCFVPMDKNNFAPIEANLLEEFFEAGWKNLKEARNLIKDKSTKEAIDFLEKKCFK